MSVKKGAAETRRLYHSAAYECGLRTAECRIFLILCIKIILLFKALLG